MAKKFKHELGKEAEDLLTGFKGIITSRTEHITGCNVYGIAPKVIKDDGKVAETQWFDEARIKIIGDGIVIDDHNDGAGENPTDNHKSQPQK